MVMYLLPIYTVYKTYYNLGRDSTSWNPADFVKTSVIPPVQRNISIRKQFRDFYNLVNNLVSIFFYVGCQNYNRPLWSVLILPISTEMRTAGSERQLAKTSANEV